MSLKEKLHILCLLSDSEAIEPDYFKNFFSDDDVIEVHNSQDKEISFDVLITDTVYEGDIDKVLYISDSEKLSPRISPELLGHQVTSVTLKRFVGLDSSINIDSLYEGDFKNFKVTDPFSIGHYQDVIGAYLYRNNFDYKKLQDSYQSIIKFILNELELLPIEVEFVRGEDYVALQIHSAISKLQKTSTEITEFISSIDTTIVDTYYLKSSKELVFNVILIKDIVGKAVVFNDLEKFNSVNPNLSFYENTESFVKVEKDPVKFKHDVNTKSVIETVRKVIDWLKDRKYILKDSFVFENELEKFPESQLVKGLKQEDLDFIRKVISDYKVEEAYELSIAGASDDLCSDQDFVKKLGESLKEIELYEVSSLFENDSDFIQVVGGKFDEENEVTLVKGNGEDNVEDENTLVKGEQETHDDIIKIQSTFNEVRNDLATIFINSIDEGSTDLIEVKSQLGELVSRKLGLSKEQNERLVSKIVGSCAIEKTAEESKSSSRSEHFTKLQNEKLKKIIESKDELNNKLKVLLSSAKEQLSAVRETDKEILGSPLGDDSSAESKSKKLEQLLSFKNRELKAKTITFERKEQVFEDELKRRDERIHLLERKLLESKTEKSQLFEEVKNDDSQLKALSLEKDQLENKLAHSEQKSIELANTIVELKRNHESEVEDLVKPEILNAEKEKNNFLQEKIKELEEMINSKGEPESDAANNVQLQKALQDMTDSHEKALSLEAKKHEQKMKLLNGKVIELEKVISKLKGAQGGQVSGTKLKQLERNLDKTREQKDKAIQELADKKKEAHSYKQESAMLQNKLSEIEKKLAKYEKKAA